MGACNFSQYEAVRKGEHGPDAKTCFRRAVESAQWEHGHGGYTGTLAEKHGFVMIEPPVRNLKAAYKRAHELVMDDRVSDKWGPAGCIRVGAGKRPHGFLFFGWASS
jgi:hypothetical protein